MPRKRDLSEFGEKLHALMERHSVKQITLAKNAKAKNSDRMAFPPMGVNRRVHSCKNTRKHRLTDCKSIATFNTVRSTA